MSSDTTGEIYVVVREDGGSTNAANPTSGLPSPTGTAPSSSSTKGAGAVAAGWGWGGWNMADFAAIWAGIMALLLM